MSSEVYHAKGLFEASFGRERRQVKELEPRLPDSAQRLPWPPRRAVDLDIPEPGRKVVSGVLPTDVLPRGERHVEPRVRQEAASFENADGGVPGGESRREVRDVEPGETPSVLAGDPDPRRRGSSSMRRT